MWNGELHKTLRKREGSIGYEKREYIKGVFSNWKKKSLKKKDNRK